MTAHRTEKQRKSWRRLTPYTRRLLMSHLPDLLEREEEIRSGTMADLESTFGPRQWDATVAVLAEGEATEEELNPPDDSHDMTLAEIGEVIGVSRERVRAIQEQALEKLRKAPFIAELLNGAKR